MTGKSSTVKRGGREVSFTKRGVLAQVQNFLRRTLTDPRRTIGSESTSLIYTG